MMPKYAETAVPHLREHAAVVALDRGAYAAHAETMKVPFGAVCHGQADYGQLVPVYAADN